MNKEIFTIIENRQIATNTYFMRLEGNTADIVNSGTFVNIRLDGLYLRRPISVCNSEDGVLTLVYKAVGKGTEKMTAMGQGEKLELLTGLGNGYDITVDTKKPLLIGGGVGVPPLYMLCKKLREKGLEVSVILGFNRADEVFFEEEFKALGAKVTVMTADGSYGGRGFVTDAMDSVDYDYFFTCGPEPMLKAIFAKSGDISGQFSFEERMGCGFGACMGCSCKTVTGNKRICREGPVLVKEDILWQK